MNTRTKENDVGQAHIGQDHFGHDYAAQDDATRLIMHSPVLMVLSSNGPPIKSQIQSGTRGNLRFLVRMFSFGRCYTPPGLTVASQRK